MSLDLSGILSSIPGSVQAASMATAISSVTGSTPIVHNRGDYYEIILDGEQEDRLSNWILAQMNKEPGQVRVNLSGVATKVVFREYWPQMAAILAAGLVVGYLAKRGSR